MAMIVSIECPVCATAFPVDPDKVPQGGARTECTECASPFAVDPTSWGEDGAAAEPWAPPRDEAESTEAIVEGPDVFMEEFAPVDEAWSSEDDQAPAEHSWQDAVEEVGESSEAAATGFDTLRDEEVADEPSGVFGLTEPDSIPVAGDFETPEAELPWAGSEGGEVEEDAFAGVEDVILDAVEVEAEADGGIEIEDAAVDVADAVVGAEDVFEDADVGFGVAETETETDVEAEEVQAGTREEADVTLEGFSAEVEDFSAEVEGVSAEVDDFSAEVEDFSAEVEGVSAEVEDFSAEVEDFSAEVEGLPAGLESLSTEGETDDGADFAGPAQTGELVTDQWAGLVDDDADDGTEITADWGGDDGAAWVVETEESASLEIGEIEVERLDTVEEHVRAAQGDPDLTEPAEGVDTNEVSHAGVDGFGDFMTGGEMVLPEDALDADGPGLHLDDDGSGLGDVVLDDAIPEVEPEAPEAVAEPALETPDSGLEVSAEEEGVQAMGTTFQFGRRDPHDKARRLARVLVSDMITYNPDRHTQALHNGSVKADFEDEIEKSWAEYVEQVGPEIAESTDYWRDALNEILAGDEALF